jgi:erythromycin esterase-like protein
VVHFIDWLHTFNASRPADQKAGFYGMDLYSLYSSIQAVIDYLDRIDPEAAQRARYRYGCFEQYGEDPQAYGYAASFGLTQTCEDDVVKQLMEMRERAMDYLHWDGRTAEDAFFYSEQNARLVRNAEQYYRAMFKGRDDSWNLRDRHMAETLESLMEFLGRRVAEPRLVVWAHNSHLGDARATEMSRRGELNVGQLVRERHGHDAWLIGCTTYTGTVTAAADWDGPHERKRVRPGLPGSSEELLHEIGNPAFMLNLRDELQPRDALSAPRLERAIGVIYRPESERLSHYFHARPAEQFDALIHIDQTHALQPLDNVSEWDTEEVPETYPFAI